MQSIIKGNCIRFVLTEADNNIVVTLPDGYSYEAFMLSASLNINYINPLCKAQQAAIYHFPPVRSKSPITITLTKINTSQAASAVISIVKFGQLPDSHYFDGAFEPILVTGDDGNEYNVIPSDQFK